jgi:hypothetical protein
VPLVILHHLLNVSVQLANKRGFIKKIIENNIPLYNMYHMTTIKRPHYQAT